MGDCPSFRLRFKAGRRPWSAPNTYRGSVVQAGWSQPETSREELASQRPRNSFVPSYRPTQKWGSTRKGCLVISRFGREGAEPGNHVFGIEFGRSPSRRPIKREGSRVKSLSAPTGSEPQQKSAGKTRLNPIEVPVRRPAHRPGSVKPLEIGSGQRLSPFDGWQVRFGI